VFKLNQKILRNIILIIAGAIILGVVEFKLIQLPEILMLLLSVIGFIVLVDGIYELYKTLRHKDS